MEYEATAVAGPEPALEPAPVLPKRVYSPIRDRIIVLRDPPATESEGGIGVPEAHQEDVQEGTVLAVGKLVEEIKAGDRVYFGTHAGYPLKERLCVALREDEVVCRIFTYETPAK